MKIQVEVFWVVMPQHYTEGVTAQKTTKTNKWTSCLFINTEVKILHGTAALPAAKYFLVLTIWEAGLDPHVMVENDL
jgi:hypothetical protein